MDWQTIKRPGYFGRKRDEIVSGYDREFGVNNWRLVWATGFDSGSQRATFFNACRMFYEESYYRYLSCRPEELAIICAYQNCVDNASSNVSAGLDYMHQEADSTHIQDIAIRNVLRRCDRWFEGFGKILTIRGPDSKGFRFNPGNIPFAWPHLIATPSLAPSWAKPGSVEDFWQSNKYLQTRIR